MKNRLSAVRRVSFLSGILLTALFVQPRPAYGITVAAQICSGPLASLDFSCTLPGDAVLDFGIRSGPGLQLANTYSILPFTFSDAFMNFSGTILTTDIAGKFIYEWGGGVATAGVLGLGDTLDVLISQNFVTTPGLWSFAEFDNGTCNGNAAGAGDSSFMEGAVNGALLPVLGVAGDCALAPFSLAAGPFAKVVGGVTNMTAAAQFSFNLGLAPQSITLPWGDDFPDPDLNGLIPDPTNINSLPLSTPLTLLTPEPATFGLIGGALLGIGVLRFHRRRRL